MSHQQNRSLFGFRRTASSSGRPSLLALQAQGFPQSFCFWAVSDTDSHSTVAVRSLLSHHVIFARTRARFQPIGVSLPQPSTAQPTQHRAACTSKPQRRSIEQAGAFFILVSPAVFVAPTDHYGQKKNGLG